MFLNYLIFFIDIPFTYAKIWGETNFKPQEFPQSGWKAEDVEEKKKKRKRKKVERTQSRLGQKK